MAYIWSSIPQYSTPPRPQSAGTPPVWHQDSRLVFITPLPLIKIVGNRRVERPVSDNSYVVYYIWLYLELNSRSSTIYWDILSVNVKSKSSKAKRKLRKTCATFLSALRSAAGLAITSTVVNNVGSLAYTWKVEWRNYLVVKCMDPRKDTASFSV